MGNPLEKKDRMKIPRAVMPQQGPQERKRNFKEVPFGLTEEMALREASRCLNCPKAPCIKGCPVDVDIPGFIQLILEKDYAGRT
jgi:glutamate synthase (NADPH/NADH) small chain